MSLQRITVPQIIQDSWFKKGFKPDKEAVVHNINLDDVDAVFNPSSVSSCAC